MAYSLTGLRVVDLSHVIAGPLASFYLAQQGADVVKVESPHGGDVMRASGKGPEDGDTPAGFAALNAGKQSLAVDIRTPQGAAAVRALAAQADIFIENFRPGVVAKYGLDYEAIRAVKPDIIYCSLSGYGQQGAWSGRGAYDHVVQALTGMMMMQGDGADASPMKVGFPVIDVAVGMLAALSIVSAIHRRDREGAGQYIDASMAQASLMLMYPNASNYLTSGSEPARVGNRGYTGSPTADTWRCADGWLATAANTPPQFRKLAAVLGVEDLCTDGNALDLESFNAASGFVVAKDMDYLRQRFTQAFAGHSAAVLEERLNAAGVPAARVRRLGEFLSEVDGADKLTLPDVRFDQGGRTVRTPGLGFVNRFDGEQPTRGAPGLGADNAALLDHTRGISG